MMGEVPHLAPENTKPVEMGYVPKMLNHNTYVIKRRNRFSLKRSVSLESKLLCWRDVTSGIREVAHS